MITVLPGETEEVLIAFNPTEPGVVSGRITLNTNDPTNPQWILDIPSISVQGQLPGTITLESTTLDLIEVGALSTRIWKSGTRSLVHCE